MTIKSIFFVQNKNWYQQIFDKKTSKIDIFKLFSIIYKCNYMFEN